MNYSAAERQYRRAAEGRERVFGMDDEGTLKSIHSLGHSLYNQKKYSAAEREYRRAAEGRERVLGTDHKDTLNSIHWLDDSRHKARRLTSQAKEIMDTVAKLYKHLP